MPVTDDVLVQAQDGDAMAIAAILSVCYPRVCRIARALSPAGADATPVIETVMQRSVRLLPNWRSGATAENWFYHHTLLTAREATAAVRVSAGSDPLQPAGESDPAYAAFLRALRELPPQQAEAFILHHGERLNPRYLGVAMDCSTKAADVHLRSATERLGRVSGEHAAVHVAHLHKAYIALSPNEAALDEAVRRYVAAAQRRPAPWRLLVWIIVVAAIIAALAWVGWTYIRD